MKPIIYENDIMPKEKLYKTAYSHLYEVYVSIDSAHQDSDGAWIYKCSSNYSDDADRRFEGCLFRTNELDSFCL